MRYTIGLREAGQQLAKHVRAVEQGHEVILTRRGRPVARLVADPARDRTEDPAWQAAYRRMIERLERGLPLGGVRWTRDEIHER